MVDSIVRGRRSVVVWEETMHEDVGDLLDRAVSWYRPSEPDPIPVAKIATSRRRRRRFAAIAVSTVVTVLSLTLVVGALTRTRSGTPATQTTSPSGVLLGPALADALGLKPVTAQGVTGCKYFIELDGGVGYCVDAVVDNEHDATILMIQISGRQPTDIDERIFNLQQRMEALPGDASYDAQRAAFVQEIEKLREQQGS